MVLRLALGSLLVALAGCGGEGRPAGGEAPAEAGAPAARSRVPRLTHVQWENTVRDLFQGRAPAGLSAVFSPDGEAADGDALAVSEALGRDYQRAAEAVAEAVARDDAAIGLFLPPGDQGDDGAKARRFVERFGLRAFRKPLAGGEVDRLLAFFGPQGEALKRPGQDAFHAGVELVIAAALQSPWFLYRPEAAGEADARGWVRLGGFELASRLSYALWDTMPDEALLADAQGGALDHDHGLRQAAVRALADERAAERLVRFHDRLVGGERYAGIVKDPAVFPGWDGALAGQAREELRRFVRFTLVEQGGGLGGLLTSRTAFVDARLGALLGVEGAPEGGFARVELPPERAGLLTRPGWLALSAGPTERDTIRRGVFVLRALLCQEPGLPSPSAVEEARQQAVYPPDATNRQRTEILTSGEGCRGCHAATINPAGFAFERFDAIGRLIADEPTQAGLRPVDAAASLSVGDRVLSFDGASGLSEALARLPQAHRCYARRWFEGLTGRPAGGGDQALIDEVAGLSEAGASTRDLLLAVVTSAAFRHRLAEAP